MSDSIKLAAPEGITSFSVAGETFNVGDDGTFTAPRALALRFYELGCGNAPEPEPPAKGKKAAEPKPEA